MHRFQTRLSQLDYRRVNLGIRYSVKLSTTSLGRISCRTTTSVSAWEGIDKRLFVSVDCTYVAEGLQGRFTDIKLCVEKNGK